VDDIGDFFPAVIAWPINGEAGADDSETVLEHADGVESGGDSFFPEGEGGGSGEEQEYLDFHKGYA